MAFLYCFSVRPKGTKESQGLVSEIRLDIVLFITSMPKSIISVVVWSSVIFFNFFLVRPKGMKETEELVDEDQLNPVSFLASILPKSIISSSI